MKSAKAATITGLLTALSICQGSVETGLDRAGEYRQVFRGKRLGIITNHTAYDSQGRFVVDVLRGMAGVTVSALFSPEHGLWGKEQAGENIKGQTDPVYHLPVYSLYGQTRKPTSEMLRGIDVLVFDIQDIGARFYTYISTMSLAMEAAAENGKRFVVLDRPNLINGSCVEGNVLDAAMASFVGMHPVPVRHGMTAGELATMFNERGWLAGRVRADLVVIPMEGWRRAMWYDRTGLRFIKPSPNMPDLETAAVYPGLCLLEGTNVSEGRGTDRPFRQFGAPWIDSQDLTRRIKSAGHALRAGDVHAHKLEISGPGMSRRPDRRYGQGPARVLFQRHQNCRGDWPHVSARFRMEGRALRPAVRDVGDSRRDHEGTFCRWAAKRMAACAQILREDQRQVSALPGLTRFVFELFDSQRNG
jgi:uncharacterized protein YbbC (DUF1343 family)